MFVISIRPVVDKTTPPFSSVALLPAGTQCRIHAFTSWSQIALLRGSSLPDSLVTVRARICSPSEGSKAFRLATRRTEGRYSVADGPEGGAYGERLGQGCGI